ncbi:MAG TPA: hypothetical protein VFI78_07995 [Salinimicrobium sp.]|nr:hypothetical protein [Salinimicrobium sp.]
MSRLKFETQFKEKLEKQEIRPSAGSWEKLESRLNGEDKKPRWIWWAGIAASVAVGILIFSLIFNNNPIPQGTEIVGQPSTIETRFEEKETDKNQQFVSNEAEFITTSKTSDEINISVKGTKKTSSVQAATASSEDESLQIKKRKQLKAIWEERETVLLSTEIAKSFAGTTSEEKIFHSVTDAEIDALLKQARLKLPPHIFESTQNQISAGALLNGIETELNRSFRDKILSDLGEKLLEFALASRNY